MDWYRVESIMGSEMGIYDIEEWEKARVMAKARLWLTVRAAPKDGRTATPLEREDVVRAVAYAAGGSHARRSAGCPTCR